MKRILLGALLSIAGFAAFFAVPFHTEAAINPQINFQGKLANPDGTNVTNGTYSIVFSIYSVASGGTAVWTETQPSVTVADGIFQVSLGSVTTLPGSVDFNSNSLYLGVKVGADAEMTPRIQFTSTPYAFNSDKLGGIASTGFVQLSPGAQQTGNINVSGSVSAGSSLAFTAASAASIQSASSQSLNITGNAASTFSTSAGQLTLQSGSGTISFGTTTTVTSTNGMTFSSGGSMSIVSATTNAVSLDSGTTGAVNIGTGSNAKAITIGNTTSGTTITQKIGTGTTAFSIQGTTPATDTYLAIDSSLDRIYIGGSGAVATPTILVLSSKSGAGDPTGVNGGEYYNSTNNKFRCYQGGIWQDCTAGLNSITKTADQSAYNTTAFQNDNTLFFSVNANTTYVFDAIIPVNSTNATADFKYTFTTPASGTTLNIAATTYSSATANVFCNIIASGQTCTTTVNTAVNNLRVQGYVTVGTVAGTVQFQFGQSGAVAQNYPVIKKGATLWWHQSN